MLYFSFILGLLFGSFLNVVILRLEKEEKGIFNGRSKCPKCNKVLSWYELIPIISFILQGGKCRNCKKSISWQYPLVEFLTGFVFAILYWKFGFSFSSPTLFALSSVLIVLFVSDLRTQTIPDIIAYIGIGLAVVYVLLNPLSSMFYALIGAVIAGGFFAFLVLISKETWMGQGDIKIGIIMGLILGYPNVLVALFIAYFFGALVGIFLIITKKKTMRSSVPFGPFLILATFATMFYGEQIISWYLKILR
ncbi:MAG: prepilin peptidase [Candidatus Berkelbacteria bacterium]|nr:prepilin peptidase [Candidatus Berkelbacteria bacterium]